MEHYGLSYFEGTEKKVELIVDPRAGSLRARGRAYWDRVVRRAGAEILSETSNDSGVAYLLSESSLFVFDHKIVMLTCGRTTLHDAVLEVLETVPPDQVRMLVFERKNEIFPHSQPTSFHEDARILNERLPGKAFQFGHEDEHHLYLFHLDRSYDALPEDVTVEVLMYGIDQDVRRHFSLATHDRTEAVREATGVDRLIPGFEVDDHLFEPSGYSLNGLRGDEYYTVHVTPENVSSYASFETNARRDDAGEIVERVLEAFRPRSWDLVTFDTAAPFRVAPRGYRRTSEVSQPLTCGYHARFSTFHRPQERIAAAVELPVPSSSVD